MSINLLDLQPNKVSTQLEQYSIIVTGDTGVGKTTSLMKMLKEMNPNKEPLFLEFEDRFQNIANIFKVKINTMSDFKNIMAQLKNPKLKEKFSCIVVDPLDKYEEFCERYVLETRDAEILNDVGAYGEGSVRFKSALRNIGVLQNLGYTIHFISQTTHGKNSDTKTEYDMMKLNKNTMSYCREAAFLVGYMWNEDGERYITFKKTTSHPHLKDTFGMPDKIKINEFIQVWKDVINKLGEKNITTNNTIQKNIISDDEKLLNFEIIKENCNKLGQLLTNNGHANSALAVLKKHMGINNDGSVKGVSCLHEGQIDLLRVVNIELQELVDRYKLKLS